MSDISKANSELEIALKNDSVGDYKSNLVAMFKSEHVKISRQLEKGVRPEEYSALKSLLLSIETAINVVEKMWINLQK